MLLALDEALAPVWPGWDRPISRELMPVRSHWVQTGRLSSEPERVGGAVLLRNVHPQRPESREELDTLCKALVRVDSREWASLAHYRVPVQLDLSADGDARRRLRVAVCPFIAKLDDMDIHTGHRGSHAVYRLAGRDCQRLHERVRQLIPLLDSSGADLAFLPEGVLCPSLLETWRKELRSSYKARPRESALRWLLVGTGPADEGSTRNTAVVLHRSGTLIAQQDKRYPFRFTQPREWRLDDVVEPGAHEDIERGGSRTVLESDFGRVAITICEDLSRPLVFDEGLRQAGPSLLLVPVFNMPFAQHNWARAGAKDALLHIGTRVIVTNSLAVADRWPELEPCFALGIFHTKEPDSWEVEPERRIANDPTAIEFFEVSPSPLPRFSMSDAPSMPQRDPSREPSGSYRSRRTEQRRKVADRRRIIDLSGVEASQEERRTLSGVDRRSGTDRRQELETNNPRPYGG